MYWHAVALWGLEKTAELSLWAEQSVSWQASAGSFYLELFSLHLLCIFGCVIIKTIYCTMK